jgi:hypothetical protein
MKTKLFLFIPVILIIFLAVPAGAGTLTLSQFSSDSTPASVLDARFQFEVDGTELTLTVFNDTTSPNAYYINEIYWNSFSDVFLTPTSSNMLGGDPDDWSFATDQAAAPFGVFDFALTGGDGNHAPQIAPGGDVEFIFSMSSAVSQTDFITGWSTLPPGDIEALAAAKFVRGPGDDSARGAATPIPGTFLLFGSGIVGLAAFKRKLKK